MSDKTYRPNKYKIEKFLRFLPCLPQKAVHMAKYGFTVEFEMGSGGSHDSIKI